MKYIKKFYERLNHETYLRAADKLNKNHPERAKRLSKHALNTDFDRFGVFNIIKEQSGFNFKADSPVKIGKYKLTNFQFDSDLGYECISCDGNIDSLYFWCNFKEEEETAELKTMNGRVSYNNYEIRTFSIIVPYENGNFGKAYIEFGDTQSKFLFADRKSVVKFKNSISEIIDKSRSMYNTVEVFTFQETLYRKLDDLSKDDPSFKFDDDQFRELVENIKLKHISNNDLYITQETIKRLPDRIE